MTTTKARASMVGDTLTVSTGVTKRLVKGRSVRNTKTGNVVSFQGYVTDPNMKYKAMFLDHSTNEITRHSADYIAKYIG